MHTHTNTHAHTNTRVHTQINTHIQQYIHTQKKYTQAQTAIWKEPLGTRGSTQRPAGSLRVWTSAHTDARRTSALPGAGSFLVLARMIILTVFSLVSFHAFLFSDLIALVLKL